MTHDEMIAVIQAHKDGKEIEYWDGNIWDDCNGDPAWDFSEFKYRVKPQQIEAWGVVSGGELLDAYKEKNAAIYYWARTSNATLIRLIPDPNYTQSPLGDNTNGDVK